MDVRSVKLLLKLLEAVTELQKKVDGLEKLLKNKKENK